MMRLSMLLVWVVCVLMPGESAAQRRDGGGGGRAKLEITLEHPTRFATTTVLPGRYRLSLDGTTLTLLQARTMVTAARVPLEESVLEETVAEATATVSVSRRDVAIRVKVRDREYVARGERVAGENPRGPSVDLASRKNVVGITGGIPTEKTERELIAQSLSRYEKDIAHCADQAHKQRWTTDHPRFRRCVCPLTTKWRMPKVEKATRVHRPLAKRRSGYSITVTEAGKVADCRAWIGAKPPADEKVTAAAKEKTTP